MEDNARNGNDIFVSVEPNSFLLQVQVYMKVQFQITCTVWDQTTIEYG